ncbi:cytochrome P450 [Streptomyces sp. NPDC092307]|uniref:cytochrome P450 n=1 Tax=Streptomyces sp. NPDC092307 TaxID=3366013 RepID=UPI0038074452
MREEELRSTAYLMLLVGHDTTMNLIGNGFLALLRHPDQTTRLHTATPGGTAWARAVEELLRYDSPVRDATFRCAAESFTLHGRTIAVGDVVSLLIGSANRDERRFAAADRLDVGRAPNEHLALGFGPHFCVGAALARLEAAVAFPLLLERLGPVRLAKPADELMWRPARVMRGLQALPLIRT